MISKKIKDAALVGIAQARAKIELGWTQNAFAKDSEGNSVGAQAQHAVCWCLAGAFMAICLDADVKDFLLLVRVKQRESLGHFDISAVDWNDEEHRTKEEVLEFIDGMRKIVEETEEEPDEKS